MRSRAVSPMFLLSCTVLLFATSANSKAIAGNVTLKLANATKQIIYVTGSRGTDWGGSVKRQPISPGQTIEVGRMTEATQGTSDHRGWIFLGLGNASKPLFQLYVADGTSRGVFDYAVQHYDVGKNTKGDTIAQTEVMKNDNPKEVLFKISFEFDPWMSRLDPARQLHQITIPGTHDSGTRGLSAISECQNTTIEDQLLMGVRYFDIRLDCGTDDLRVVHGGLEGSSNTDLYLPDVARMFHAFLTGASGFPSKDETVIAQLKCDRGSGSGVHDKVVKILKDVFKNAPNRLYLRPIRLPNGRQFSAIPTLKELKGKLVLVRRYDYDKEEDAEAGTPVKYFASGAIYNDWSKKGSGTWPDKFASIKFDWPDNEDNTFHFSGTWIDYRNRHGLSFFVQDAYSIDKRPDFQPPHFNSRIEAKYANVKKYLDAAASGSLGDSWLINFVSCTENLKNPIDYSTKLNPKVAQYFRNPPPVKTGFGFGTILLDFAYPELVRSIIAANR